MKKKYNGLKYLGNCKTVDFYTNGGRELPRDINHDGMYALCIAMNELPIFKTDKFEILSAELFCYQTGAYKTWDCFIIATCKITKDDGTSVSDWFSMHCDMSRCTYPRRGAGYIYVNCYSFPMKKLRQFGKNEHLVLRYFYSDNNVGYIRDICPAWTPILPHSIVGARYKHLKGDIMWSYPGKFNEAVADALPHLVIGARDAVNHFAAEVIAEAEQDILARQRIIKSIKSYVSHL